MRCRRGCCIWTRHAKWRKREERRRKKKFVSMRVARGLEPRQREKESGSGLRSSLYIRVCVTFLLPFLSLSLYLGMNISQTLNKGEDGREESSRCFRSRWSMSASNFSITSLSLSLSLSLFRGYTYREKWLGIVIPSALQFGVESHFSWRNFIRASSIIAEASIPATHFPARFRLANRDQRDG